MQHYKIIFLLLPKSFGKALFPMYLLSDSYHKALIFINFLAVKLTSCLDNNVLYTAKLHHKLIFVLKSLVIYSMLSKYCQYYCHYTKLIILDIYIFLFFQS